MYLLYISGMRTHSDIIDDAGGPSQFARSIGVEPNTVFPWRRADRIPAAHWAVISGQNLATLDELASGADRRKRA